MKTADHAPVRCPDPAAAAAAAACNVQQQQHATSYNDSSALLPPSAPPLSFTNTHQLSPNPPTQRATPNVMRRVAAAISSATKTAAAASPAAAATTQPRAQSHVAVKDEGADAQAAAEAKVDALSSPPLQWREWLALIEKMREGRDAPVDMMGAGACLSP